MIQSGNPGFQADDDVLKFHPLSRLQVAEVLFVENGVCR